MPVKERTSLSGASFVAKRGIVIGIGFELDCCAVARGPTERRNEGEGCTYDGPIPMRKLLGMR